MTPLRLPVAVLAAMLLTSACSRAEVPPQEDAGPVDYLPDPAYDLEPQLTPAESARATAAIRAHADSMTRAVRAQAGDLLDADPPRTPPPPELTPDQEYARCMEQARTLDSVIRAQVEGACRTRRAARSEE